MPPITWRTVTAPSVAEAARPFEIARQSIGDGFSALQKVLDSRNAGEAEQAKVVQDTNTAAYQDLVGKIARPEDAAAMAPQLEAQRALLTPAAKQATRGAVDERTAAVMKQITERRNFDIAEQDARELPIRDKILGLAVAGKKDDALKMLAENPLRQTADIQKAIIEGDHSNIKWNQELQRFDWTKAAEAHQAEMRPLEKRAKETSIQASQQQIAESGQRMRQNSVTFQNQQEDRQREQTAAQIAAQRAYLKESGNEYAEGVFTPNRLPELMKVMRDNKVGDDDFERQAIADRLMKFTNTQVPLKQADGSVRLVDMPMPMSRIMGAVLGSKDQWVNWRHQGWANEVQDRLTNLPKDIYTDPATGQSRNRLADNYQQFLELQARSLATQAVGAGRAGGGGKK